MLIERSTSSRFPDSAGAELSTGDPASRPPADSRASRSRRGACGRRRVGLLLPATLLAAVAISACGSSKGSSTTQTGRSLNMTRVIGSIEESFLTKRKIHAKVSCPSHVEQRAGNNFTCIATGFTGTGSKRKPFTVHVAVTQANNNGYVTYVSY